MTVNKVTDRVEGAICPNCGNNIIYFTRFIESPEPSQVVYGGRNISKTIDEFYSCGDCGIRFEKIEKK